MGIQLFCCLHVNGLQAVGEGWLKNEGAFSQDFIYFTFTNS